MLRVRNSSALDFCRKNSASHGIASSIIYYVAVHFVSFGFFFSPSELCSPAGFNGRHKNRPVHPLRSHFLLFLFLYRTDVISLSAEFSVLWHSIECLSFSIANVMHSHERKRDELYNLFNLNFTSSRLLDVRCASICLRIWWRHRTKYREVIKIKWAQTVENELSRFNANEFSFIFAHRPSPTIALCCPCKSVAAD